MSEQWFVLTPLLELPWHRSYIYRKYVFFYTAQSVESFVFFSLKYFLNYL